MSHDDNLYRYNRRNDLPLNYDNRNPVSRIWKWREEIISSSYVIRERTYVPKTGGPERKKKKCIMRGCEKEMSGIYRLITVIGNHHKTFI